MGRLKASSNGAVRAEFREARVAAASELEIGISIFYRHAIAVIDQLHRS